uniref:Uncharacterized protein n=1 Tax=Nothobranchius rachovii TaxID=451742 RepID=A0A1A8QUJ6_9TELE
MVGMNSNVNKILPHHRSCSSVTLVQTRFILPPMTQLYMRVAPDVAEHTISCQKHTQSSFTAFLYINVPPVVPEPASAHFIGV